MISHQILIRNKSGLHARPATDFIETAKRFESKVQVSYNGKTKNGKSVIGLLTLGIKQGSLITINIDGKDELEAMQAIDDLSSANFNEEE